MNQTVSDILPVDLGVPQGSILGPLLFLIYINDFAIQTNIDKCVLFADDTTLLIRSKDCKNILDRSLAAHSYAEEWFSKNYLVLNNEKTQRVIFTLKNVELQNNPSSVKYLGFMLDPKLKWDSHGEYVAGRLLKSIFILRNLSSAVSLHVLRAAYFSLFHTIMSYGILVWGHSSSRHRVFGLQRRAVRIVANLCYRSDCRQSFKELSILTFPCQYILDCLMHTKDKVSECTTNASYHTYDTRHKNDLTINYLRLSRDRTGSHYYGIKFYNVLPEEIKNLGFKNFKSFMKSFLVNNPFFFLWGIL